MCWKEIPLPGFRLVRTTQLAWEIIRNLRTALVNVPLLLKVLKELLGKAA